MWPVLSWRLVIDDVGPRPLHFAPKGRLEALRLLLRADKEVADSSCRHLNLRWLRAQGTQKAGLCTISDASFRQKEGSVALCAIGLHILVAC